MMPLTFTQADALFRQDKLNELVADAEGRRFLKLRSLNRTEYLERLFQAARMARPAVGARQLFDAAFNAGINTATIEACARDIYREEREQRLANEAELVNQLYRVQEFNWGGLHQNSLEKTIVDNYVKKITDYEALCWCVENELLVSMRGYVVCSWYNHWTSIIIEDIFKDHANVLPAVGLVKKIDFFVRDVPFDLKVTYLPEGYLKEKRQTAGLRPELTLLKRASRTYGLPISADLADAALLQDLWAKVADHPSVECRQLIAELVNFRDTLVTAIEQDATELICWLYENQGDRRFDASNRLFLVLVDQRNYFDSWKLKRAKPLMEEKIRGFLNGCGSNPGRQIEFDWEGERYSCVSDVVVVRHT
ncbi:MAG: hypothetical protein COS85_03670 [Armatimonadetes bacterium CG07_land_8_20_14_0_80_59_28]|nr:MAG: hypothetical protein COS85_03670 [Armatimonadetes bacterium CG07_land_8_20_14_0_80_59_28]